MNGLGIPTFKIQNECSIYGCIVAPHNRASMSPCDVIRTVTPGDRRTLKVSACLLLSNRELLPNANVIHQGISFVVLQQKEKVVIAVAST